MRDVRIRITHRCEECDGTGFVYDPFGVGWADTVGMSDEEFERWAEQHTGSWGASGALPPDEGPCGECEGRGRLERDVTPEELVGLVRA